MPSGRSAHDESAGGPPPSPPEPRRVVVPPELAGARLDEALRVLVPERSRAFHQKLVRRGKLRWNGRRVVRSFGRVEAGDVLELDELDASRGTPQSRLLRTVFVDPWLVVVDKPPGLVTHPNDRIPRGTVSDLVANRHGPLPPVPDPGRPGVVHRLDRETSGLLVLGRTVEAVRSLQAQFRRRRVEKRYLALVHGRPEADRMRLEGALGPEAPGSDRQTVEPAEGGKRARTDVLVLERFDGLAFLACRPSTGRRHQIRVHLAHAGLPLVADSLYAPAELGLPEGAPPLLRQALHAERLAFRHPGTGADVAFEAPLPEDLQRVLDWLRART